MITLIHYIMKFVRKIKDKYVIKSIERAFKIKLYDHQIQYILGHTMVYPSARGSGRTFAHMVKLCLSEGDVLRTRDIIRLSNTDHMEYSTLRMQIWYVEQLREVYDVLSSKTHLKVRKIHFD